MVAVIHYSRNLKDALQYHELKVLQGKACCIGAFNYPKDLDSLGIREKLLRLRYRAALNENIRHSYVLMSLNFDPSEILPKQKLREIAIRFMETTGYGYQPWLAYEHWDAAHPHIHIVTTNVLSNGKGMQSFDNHYKRLQIILREIEQSFGLVKGIKKQDPDETKRNAPALKLHYGKTETLKSIARVLNTVLPSYTYTSLGELNAVLKLYNVAADRGRPGSFLYEVRGLQYRILDEKGNKVGVPIKASQVPGKPMLSFLEKKFAENESLMVQSKSRLKNRIAWCFLKNPGRGFSDLKKMLAMEMIHMELGEQTGDRFTPVYYVDHKTKSVFEASRLGEEFTAKAIHEKCLFRTERILLKGNKPAILIQP